MSRTKPCPNSMHGFYVHEATLLMAGESDAGGPGAAITAALCGSWEHPPPCPLAAHHTAVQQDGETLSLRTVFATDPSNESEVRRRIEEALLRGTVARPDGQTSRWAFLACKAGDLTTAEQAHARRMAGK